MPFRCIVPYCKGNSPKGPKVSVFQFPKDENLKSRWLANISRENFTATKNTRICEQHFQIADFETETTVFDTKNCVNVTIPLEVRRLKKSAVPTIFQHYPSYMANKENIIRESRDDKLKKREAEQLQQVLKESVRDKILYENERKLTNIKDILKCIEQFTLPQNWFTYMNDSDSLCVMHFSAIPVPSVKCMFKICDKLNVYFFMDNEEIPKLGKVKFPCKVGNYNEFLELINCATQFLNSRSDKCDTVARICRLLESINTDKYKNLIDIVREQLNLICISPNNFKYSSNLLVFSCLLKTISSHSYNFLRSSGFLILPHPVTLNRICSNLKVSPEHESESENFLMYIKKRVPYLNDHEKHIVLMMDEIHLKSYFDYKNGSIVGSAFDSSQAATSAFVFMISSIQSSFKEVVHILPVKSIKANTLYGLIKDVIVGLESLGLFVVAVVTDNNSINNKAMAYFESTPSVQCVYKHPCNQQKPLFYIPDSVHLLKNIRNNWINQKNPGVCMFFPDIETSSNCKFKTASFADLRKLYEVESNSLLTFSNGLSYKSLNPSSIERQNVKLVLKVFNEYVVQALLELGPMNNLKHYKETSDFISIICTWWNIMNVKTPNKGIHKRNSFMMPISLNNGEQISFLKSFLTMLNNWKSMGCDTGMLTRETHTALYNQVQGILELTKYCVKELRMNYLLTGKIQTDNLEDRFGKYRQLAGAQYHISMRQVIECEKKIRLQSCLHLELPIKMLSTPIKNFESVDFEIDSSPLVKQNLPPLSITPQDIDDVSQYLPVITYIGGYCCKSLIKKLKCFSCKSMLTLDKTIEINSGDNNYIKNMDRGGLLYPVPAVVNTVLYTYIVVNKLMLDDGLMFTNMVNQRLTVLNLTFNILELQELVLENITCNEGHANDYLCKLIIWTSTNILLNNYCRLKNDSTLIEKQNKSKKRKFQTLSHT